MGRVSRGCAQHKWGGNHPLPKKATPTPLEITLARKTCALHTSTCEGLLSAEGSATVSFLPFFGFHHIVSGTESTSGSMLNTCVRAPCPCYWGSTDKATQCPASRDRNGTAPAELWLLSGTGMADLLWAGSCILCLTGMYTLSIHSPFLILCILFWL